MNTKDMDIITTDDLNIIINKYDDKIYDNVKADLTNDEIIKSIYDELLVIGRWGKTWRSRIYHSLM